MKLLILIIASAISSTASAIDDAPLPDFSKLSNQELIKEFERAGLALKDSFDVPTDEPNRLANPIHGPKWRHYARVRMALVRQGGVIVPDLIKLLEAERALDRGKDTKEKKITFVVELIRVLEHIGDPRAVDSIVTILEDYHLTEYCKSIAYDALMKLTFVGFHSFESEYGQNRDCVQHPLVKQKEDQKDFKRLAGCYRNWLANEGKDRTRWLDVARTHARTQLAGKDLKLAYQAISFLSHQQAQRDDKPDATLKRIAELIVEFQMVPAELPIKDYATYNQLLDSRQWYHFLEYYGPHAQPYVKTYLKSLKDNEAHYWFNYQFLERIGGKDAVAYALEKLPIIDKEVKRLKADPNTPKGFSSDDQRGWWFDSDSNAKRLFDRWVGRTFTDNNERMKWWEQNKDNSPEVWLTDNLDTVARQADEGNAMSRYIMTMMLPDMPFHRKVFKGEDILSGDGFAKDSVAIFVDGDPNLPQDKTDRYSKWLETNRSSLRYEARVGGFVLSKPDLKK